MDNKIIGYTRISTVKQNQARQEKNILRQYPEATIYAEVYTGGTTNRPVFNRVLKQLNEGDTLIVDCVTRFSRSAVEGLESYLELFNRGVNIVFIKQPYINTDVYKQNNARAIELVGEDVDLILSGVNEYMKLIAKKQIIIAFENAEFELQQIKQRTKEGIAIAKAEGKRIGRTKGETYTTKKEQEAKDKIIKLSKDFNGNLSNDEMIKVLGISRNSFYKYKRSIIEGL